MIYRSSGFRLTRKVFCVFKEYAKSSLTWKM